MWFKEKRKSLRISLLVFFVLFLLMDLFLIYEASNTGEESSGQSTYFGTAVADAINSVATSFGEKPIITDLDSFLAFFRKLVGHYGAFLILALLATPFFLLGFDGKRLKWSIPLNFGHGFLMAAATEMIQLFTPGRAGAWGDIGIDFAGYATSGVLLTLILHLVRYLSERKKTVQTKRA